LIRQQKWKQNENGLIIFRLLLEML
jgi:hypothetical protein